MYKVGDTLNFKGLREVFIEDVDEDITDMEIIGKAKKLINRAYKELAKREGLEKVITSLAENGEMTKPYDLIKVVEIQKDGVAKPYKMEGKRIVVPFDGEARLIYQYAPDNLQDDDDEPLTNVANEEFIINYAIYLYLMIEEEIDRAQLYKSLCDKFQLFKPAKMVKTINVYGM